MQAVHALRRAGGIARGLVLFTLRRARTVQRTLFSSSTVSTQLALLAINFCFLYAGAFLEQQLLVACVRQTVATVLTHCPDITQTLSASGTSLRVGVYLIGRMVCHAHDALRWLLKATSCRSRTTKVCALSRA